jgi:hypothetical protein
MPSSPRLDAALDRIDAANAQDPRTDMVDGTAVPRELAFTRRVCDWVSRLSDHPSEALLLAARGHTLRRWQVPRDKYPKTTAGYRQWRRACAQFHADQTEGILRDAGYDDTTLARVRALITRQDWRHDAEGRVLEDADCLAFLELKLDSYLDEWAEDKTVDILKKTIAKMTPRAVGLATQLRLTPRSAGLLARAAGQAPTAR